jgi:hypothetical protein
MTTTVPQGTFSLSKVLGWDVFFSLLKAALIRGQPEIFGLTLTSDVTVASASPVASPSPLVSPSQALMTGLSEPSSGLQRELQLCQSQAGSNPVSALQRRAFQSAVRLPHIQRKRQKKAPNSYILAFPAWGWAVLKKLSKKLGHIQVPPIDDFINWYSGMKPHGIWSTPFTNEDVPQWTVPAGCPNKIQKYKNKKIKKIKNLKIKFWNKNKITI